MKKLVFFILLLLLSFFIFIYLYNKEINYEISYEINSYKINEKYDKNKKYYNFILTINDNTFEKNLDIKYTNKRKLISNIKTNNDCIEITVLNEKYDICKKDDEYISKYYNFENLETKCDKYENIDICNLLNKSILIWNYNGFISLNKNNNKTIKIFSSDKYEPVLTTQIDKYLFIPDFENKYNYSKYYLINFNNGELKDYLLDTEISVDSYILGSKKNKLYLFDEKAEQEYEISILKGKIKRFDSKILVNNKWEKVTKKDLLKEKLYFIEDRYFFYSLEEGILYYNEDNLKIKIINQKVNAIVKEDSSNVYFIMNSSLYNFNFNNGITKMLNYSELNFNYSNVIFIK